MLRSDWTMSDSDLLALEFQKDVQVFPPKNLRMQEGQLHQIKLIQDYININKPLLNQARRQIIEQKLEMEKVAKQHTLERIKKDDYMVRYDYNPLSEKENERQNRSKSKQQKLKSNRSTQKLSPFIKGTGPTEPVCLVNALNDLRKNPFHRDNSDIIRVTTMFKHLSSEINDNANNLAYNLGTKKKDTEEVIMEGELTFDQILVTSDSNYYAQHQGPINIFEFMHGNLRSILNNDILKKYYFNFTSYLEKSQRYKINIYRELSQLARTFVTRNNISKSARLDVLTSADLSISAKDIRFGDLISIGSGRMDPPLVYSILFEGNAQKDGSPKSSIIDDEPIDYQPNKHQKQTDYSDDLNFRQERGRYLVLENSPFEEMCVRKYQKIQKEVVHNIDLVRNIKKNTIKDVKLQEEYRKVISRNVEILANMDEKRKEEPERVIRESKVNKNRQERLKIKEMIKTLQITNQYKQMLAPIVSNHKKKK